jgi:hypothetical protein
MNETRISIPVKCRFPATNPKEVERKISEQSNAGQGKARQGRAEREQGREGREEMNFLGATSDRQRCSLQNAVCGPPMDLSEPLGQLDDGT